MTDEFFGDDPLTAEFARLLRVHPAQRSLADVQASDPVLVPGDFRDQPALRGVTARGHELLVCQELDAFERGGDGDVFSVTVAGEEVAGYKTAAQAAALTRYLRESGVDLRVGPVYKGEPDFTTPGPQATVEVEVDGGEVTRTYRVRAIPTSVEGVFLDIPAFEVFIQKLEEGVPDHIDERRVPSFVSFEREGDQEYLRVRI